MLHSVIFENKKELRLSFSESRLFELNGLPWLAIRRRQDLNRVVSDEVFVRVRVLLSVQISTCGTTCSGTGSLGVLSILARLSLLATTFFDRFLVILKGTASHIAFNNIVLFGLLFVILATAALLGPVLGLWIEVIILDTSETAFSEVIVIALLLGLALSLLASLGVQVVKSSVSNCACALGCVNIRKVGCLVMQLGKLLLFLLLFELAFFLFSTFKSFFFSSL